ALVGARGRRAPRVPGRDRQTLLHAPQPLAPARDGAFPAQTPRTALRAAMSAGKYGAKAERWSEDAYADTETYLRHRGEAILAHGPRLASGDALLDPACGDGALADYLPGLDYTGVDVAPEMVEVGRRRGRSMELGDSNDYEPSQPVAATTCFRAVYYATDRASFFRRVAGYTERK